MTGLKSILIMVCLSIARGSTDVCVDDPASPMISSPLDGEQGVPRVFTKEIWEVFVKGTASLATTTCKRGYDFFKYENFIEAAAYLPDFANSGDFEVDKREVAAFLAHCAHETSGGWETAPCGQSYGFCFVEERGCETHPCTQYCRSPESCSATLGFPCPCTPGVTYHGRGPLQISGNLNYGYISKNMLQNQAVLLDHPYLLEDDPVLSWRSALWFWMRPHQNKPSCHDIMTDVWHPSEYALTQGFRGGFGATINVVDGGLECGCNPAHNRDVEDRVLYYKRLTALLGVSPCSDPNHSLRCNGMPAFGSQATACKQQISSSECADAEPREPRRTTETVRPVDSSVATSESFNIATPPSSSTPAPAQSSSLGSAPSASTPNPPNASTINAENIGCRRNPDCSSNPWCEDESYDAYCPAQVSTCPAPMCTESAASVGAETMADAPSASTNNAENIACRRNPDCDSNPWCEDESYDAYCPAQVSSCPAPMCVKTAPSASAENTQTAAPEGSKEPDQPVASGAGSAAVSPTGDPICQRNRDCKTNPWCEVESYDVYCPEQILACPAPMCVKTVKNSLLERMRSSNRHW